VVVTGNKFSIAFVCTGNRFRSVLAEAYVRRLTLGLPVTTESFGTLQLRGVPALPEAAELARASGVDVSAHASRWIRGQHLEELDLVLGFDETHVREAVVEAGAPRERTFGMRHFVRLLDSLPEPPGDESAVVRARSLVRQADELRRADMPPVYADNMPDPLGKPWKLQRDTAAEIRELALAVTARLFGVTGAHALPPLPEKLRNPLPLRRRLRLG
jgi:protein-tyrosine-phosphatase